MANELLPNVKQSYRDANGEPLVGGKLFSYEAGTTTPLATYVDQAGTTPNTNPIIMDARGECDVFITSGLQYKFVLKDADDVVQWTKDDVSGVGFSGITGTGDVAGPASSVNNEVALFSGTTGKVIKRASGSGIVKLISGVISYITGIDLDTETTGTLPIAKGGTGETTALAALLALLPSLTGNAGKFFGTDGSGVSWGNPLPTGGSANQYLAKNNGTDYNVGWQTNPEYLHRPERYAGSRGVPLDISAGTAIAVSSSYYKQYQYIQGNGGGVTMSADPPIAPGGFEGQELRLILRDASKPITIPTGLTGVDLRGGSLVMDELNQTEIFHFDGVDWVLKR